MLGRAAAVGLTFAYRTPGQLDRISNSSNSLVRHVIDDDKHS